MKNKLWLLIVIPLVIMGCVTNPTFNLVYDDSEWMPLANPAIEKLTNPFALEFGIRSYHVKKYFVDKDDVGDEVEHFVVKRSDSGKEETYSFWKK